MSLGGPRELLNEATHLSLNRQIKNTARSVSAVWHNDCIMAYLIMLVD
jgi:hypothetical protein